MDADYIQIGILSAGAPVRSRRQSVEMTKYQDLLVSLCWGEGMQGIPSIHGIHPLDGRYRFELMCRSILVL